MLRILAVIYYKTSSGALFSIRKYEFMRHKMLKSVNNKLESDTCVVLLHGFGADMNDLFSMKALFEACHVVSFQAPIDLSNAGYMGGYAWFSLDFTPYGISYNTDEAEEAITQLADQLQDLRKKFKKLVICGFSQGSILAHALLLRYPKLLNGAICLSGRYSEFVFENAASDHLKDTPVFISHGTQDEVIPVELGHKIIDFYKQTGAKLFSKIYPMGHEISLECQQDLVKWFTQASKMF